MLAPRFPETSVLPLGEKATLEMELAGRSRVEPRRAMAPAGSGSGSGPLGIQLLAWASRLTGGASGFPWKSIPATPALTTQIASATTAATFIRVITIPRHAPRASETAVVETAASPAAVPHATNTAARTVLSNHAAGMAPVAGPTNM